MKCFLEDIQNGADLDRTTETLLREMIERKRRWWDVDGDDGNRVVEWGNEEDGRWLWLVKTIAVVLSLCIRFLCGLWSAVLWCVTKLFVWRERETTTWTCCDHGDDLSNLNSFGEDVDWMDLIRWCMSDEGLCKWCAWVTLLCVEVHWAGTRISILVNFFESL